MEYAIYPFRVMKITQNHNQGNHLAHWKNSKNYSDKPWDEALADSGRSYFEPQNDFRITRISGNTKNAYNVWLTSVNKLQMPCGRNDYLHITLTHMNSDDMSKIKVGQVLGKGSRVLREGTSGLSTGNHFHITANVGKYYGLLENSNKKWCFTYEKSLLPDEAFYLDLSFTSVYNANGYKFVNKPVPVIPKPPVVEQPKPIEPTPEPIPPVLEEPKEEPKPVEPDVPKEPEKPIEIPKEPIDKPNENNNFFSVIVQKIIELIIKLLKGEKK